jgi:hypothetical protein
MYAEINYEKNSSSTHPKSRISYKLNETKIKALCALLKLISPKCISVKDNYIAIVPSVINVVMTTLKPEPW